LVEQWSPKPRAEGSSPSAPANAGIAQSAERILGKDEVGSSNLPISSTKKAFFVKKTKKAFFRMMLPSAMMCPAGHKGKHHIMPQRSEGTSFFKAIHHFAVRRYIMKKLKLLPYHKSKLRAKQERLSF
jgi:hypothetical protein